MNIPSKTMISKKLREAIFDPRIPGPYRPIVDMADAKFLRQRAIELLHEAEWSKNPDEKMKQAISFLGYARCLHQPPTKSKPERRVNVNTRPVFVESKNCIVCEGTGMIVNSDGTDRRPCDKCGGKGKVNANL